MPETITKDWLDFLRLVSQSQTKLQSTNAIIRTTMVVTTIKVISNASRTN